MDLVDIIGQSVSVHMQTYLEIFVNLLINSTRTNELRMMIDTSETRDSFYKQEISSTLWIRRYQNTCDAINLLCRNAYLLEFRRTNHLAYYIALSVK